jgi:hypothetical protein
MHDICLQEQNIGYVVRHKMLISCNVLNNSGCLAGSVIESLSDFLIQGHGTKAFFHLFCGVWLSAENIFY